MKKLFITFFIVLLGLFFVSAGWAQTDFPPPGNGKGVIGNARNNNAWGRVISQDFELSEKAAVSTPATAGHWNIEATSSGVFVTDDQGSSTQLTSGGGDNTLDDAYDQGGAGAGGKILADSGIVEIEVADDSSNGALLLDMNDVTNDPDVLTITNAGAGADIVAPNYSVTAGAVALVSVTLTAGDITGDGASIIGGVVRSAEIVTATNVLTAAECGKVTFLNSATEFATTLPDISAITAGCMFKFIVTAAPVGANYTVITGNSLENVIYGGVNELEVDTGDDGPFVAAGDTVTFVASISVASDYVEVVTDATNWYINGQTSGDGGVTLTQAD